MTASADGASGSAGADRTTAGLAVLLHDQQRRWRAGERTRVEDYVARHPHLATDTHCILQLVVGEFLLRQECGETPSINEYQERFPGHAEALRRDLDRLANLASEALAPVSVATTVRPAGAKGAPSTRPPSMEQAPDLPAPTVERVVVPGYEVFEVLGRGGMGVVYRARQIGLDRVVALKKILYAEDAGAEQRRRFQAEAEAIARLAHPHIVQIYEVGETGGLPFFSLEYCSGGSLEKKLGGTPREAMPAARLVETLAGAVAAAHAAGIIHRDLKPANVLLTADGTPKVTDFGLAKRLNATGQTAEGAVLGTPSYMAPEQASGKGKEAGPAADVYALGAILYELLTGRPPFKAATAMETLLQVMSAEPVAVRRLQPKTPRDLETICHKCLEKDPKNRYLSAAALAEELRRFQAGEPVAARPVRGVIRLGRWAWRKPAQAGLIAMVVLAIVGSVVGVSLFAWQERKRLGQIEKANDILLSVFRDLDPEVGKQGELLRPQLGERLDRAASLLEGEAVGDPVAVARLQSVLGRTQLNLGYPKGAIALHTKARQTYETRLGLDHPDTLTSMNDLASAYLANGQLNKAVQLIEQTLQKRQTILGPNHADTLATMNNLATTYKELGQLDKSLSLHKQALEKSMAHLGPDHAETLTSMNGLANAYWDTGQLDKAIPLFEQALEKLKVEPGPDHPRTLIVMSNLADALVEAGQPERAVEMHEQILEKTKATLGADHPDTLESMNSLALAC
jgi:tetratricopeptide (TPR) repeat protein